MICMCGVHQPAGKALGYLPHWFFIEKRNSDFAGKINPILVNECVSAFIIMEEEYCWSETSKVGSLNQLFDRRMDSCKSFHFG